MTDPLPSHVVELVGVYHADGGPVGEAKYVIGKLLGTAHCALCDVTHSPVRRKPEWDRMVERVGIPFTLLHLNEMLPDIAAATTAAGSPVVLARLRDGALVTILNPAQLEPLGGSIASFEAALLDSLRQDPYAHQSV